MNQKALHPGRASAARWLIVLLVGGAAAFAQNPGKPPAPEAKIRMSSFGFRPLQARSYLDNSVNATVDFVDDHHLLVTFVSRDLMPRIPGDPDTDIDRWIRAVLIEAPSGKVLGETRWRVHDLSRYLWKLSRGRFLLRIRNTLTTIDPMGGLARGDAFHEFPLLAVDDGVLRAIAVSPDADQMIVDTAPANANRSTDPRARESTSMQSSILALSYGANGGVDWQERTHLDRPAAGTAMTFNGILDAVRDDSTHWGFEFKPFNGGKPLDLAGLESSCRPMGMFVSSFEFIALGCRGGEEYQEIAGLDLDGKAPWVLALSGAWNSASMRSAPHAGRTAFGRLLTMMGSGPSSNTPDTVLGQEVNVFQMSTGRLLARVNVTTPQQAGINFDLSPDGGRLAVMQGTELHLYALPAPTSAEKKAVEHALSRMQGK